MKFSLSGIIPHFYWEDDEGWWQYKARLGEKNFILYNGYFKFHPFKELNDEQQTSWWQQEDSTRTQTWKSWISREQARKEGAPTEIGYS